MREFQEFTKWLQDLLEGTVHLRADVNQKGENVNRGTLVVTRRKTKKVDTNFWFIDSGL